ncbi:MAG: 2,3-bisphosphoglycerate-independent phosphoglycerate mutase [Gammaproteobacteria bacterium]
MTGDFLALRNRVLLLILDGFGTNPSKANNAVLQANTPMLDKYFSEHPHTVLEASGEAVGLPPGQMGNSEVGHMTIGCGAIINQDLIRINAAIADGSFFEMSALRRALEKAKKKEGYIHISGLLSDGGVHSHINHTLALIKFCHEVQVRPVLHVITDGRDTAPKSAKKYIKRLENALRDVNGSIATLMGRYYAMDRDRRWERTIKAWEALVQLKGEKCTDAMDAVDKAYARGETDEFILPSVLGSALPMTAESEVIFTNFRNDRPRQLSKALAKPNFSGFDRGPGFEPIKLTKMTKYSKEYLGPVIFAPRKPETNLAEVISKKGLDQFHCAETEKYPHVTYFLNGGHEDAYEGEDRKMVPSPKVATYDLQPEMSAEEVADEAIKAINSDSYALIVVNFANADMVGHTAIKEAVVAAIEALDTQVGRVLDAAKAKKMSVVLTSDHGNSDEMVDPRTREPHTQHTSYPVPCLVIDNGVWDLANGQGLSAVAPTILELMGIKKPKSMTGESLLLHHIGD